MLYCDQGVHEGKHGYRVTYEAHVPGVSPATLEEFHPFDGIAAAVGQFGTLVQRRIAGGSGSDIGDDHRLSPAAALVDIELIEAVMAHKA